MQVEYYINALSTIIFEKSFTITIILFLLIAQLYDISQLYKFELYIDLTSINMDIFGAIPQIMIKGTI